DERGNFDVNLCALALLAADVHLELVAVDEAQPLVNVADTDSAAVHLRNALGRNAHTVVGNFDGETAIAVMSADVNLAALEPRRQAMLDRIFHHRLKEHAGNKRLERLRIDFLENLQLVAAEADHFDVQVVVNELELFAQRDACLRLAQQAPQDVRELQDHAAGHVRIEADQRGDGVQSVEQKMRVDLAGKRVHARFQKELLILLEVHLDARVVPDLDGHGHA